MRHFIASLTCLTSFSLLAGNATTGFTENKGQIHDQFRKPNAAVLYLLNGNGMNVQLKRDGFAYDTYVVHEGEPSADLVDRPGSADQLDRPATDPTPSTYQFHRIDIRFVNGNPNAEITTEGRSEDYTNYYTDVTGEVGATFVRSYSSITYMNVWPNIDVRFNSGEDGFKYDVIVRPGGSLADVRFKVKGAVISESVRGELVFAWNDGTLHEAIPDSWFVEGRKQSTVAVLYRTFEDGTFGFLLKERIIGTLVIDPAPTVSWATYYGGTDQDYCAAAGLDFTGNAYICGSAKSVSAIATAGTHDATYNAGFDAYAAKFTPTGARVWGTYYGGSGTDESFSIAVAPSGTFSMGGYATSTAGIATTGAHRTALAGGEDAWLARFTTAGLRIWGTYYGGTGNDRINGLAAGPDGSIAYCGTTSSTTWIASPYSADMVYGGGTSDAFLGRFNSAGSRLWGSYLGGAGADEARAVTFLGSTAIAICGSTESSSGIVTTVPGLHDATHGGGKDAFMAHYSSAGTKAWGGYYGGGWNDSASSISFIPPGNIAVCGWTGSTGMGTTGAAQPIGIGYSDGYLASFTVASGSRNWGTYSSVNGNQFRMGSVVTLADGTLLATGNEKPLTTGPMGQRIYLNTYLASSGTLDATMDLTPSGQTTAHLSTNGTAITAALTFLLGGSGFATPGAHQVMAAGNDEGALALLVPGSSAMPLWSTTPGDAGLKASLAENGMTLYLPDEWIANDPSIGSVSVMDMNGRTLYTRTVILGRSVQVSLPDAPAGVYAAVIEQNGRRTATRFIIP